MAMVESRLMEDLEEILSVLRHELGNSVNSLKLTLDVLRENYDRFDESKRKDYVKRCLEILSRQQRLTDAMKSYARCKVEELRDLAVVSFLNNFLIAAQNKIENRKIRFKQDFNREHCHVMGDVSALSAVMENILDNAVEALEDVSEPRIEFMVLQKNNSVVVVTRDNGCGIRKNDLPKVFIPLFTTKPGKMGMGLSIARKLLWKMGGRVEIESTAGVMTEVRVVLEAVSTQQEKTKSI